MVHGQSDEGPGQVTFWRKILLFSLTGTGSIFYNEIEFLLLPSPSAPFGFEAIIETAAYPGILTVPDSTP